MIMGEEERANLQIGRILRRAREERGLSLEEVEQATKIRTRYLDGLERENHDVLPGAVYVRGFLKTYADYLGLNGEELVQELKNRQAPGRERQIAHGFPKDNEFERLLINPDELRSTGSRRFFGLSVPTLALAVVVLVALVGTLYIIGRGAQSDDVANQSGASPPDAGFTKNADRGSGGQQPPPEETVEETTGAEAPKTRGGETTAPEAPAKPPEEEEPPPAETLEAKITVSDRPSWLRIEADGDVAFEQLAEPGFSETFEAEREISILAGDAGAVEVEVNGQSVGVLGSSGEVLTRRFTLKTGS